MTGNEIDFFVPQNLWLSSFVLRFFWWINSHCVDILKETLLPNDGNNQYFSHIPPENNVKFYSHEPDEKRKHQFQAPLTCTKALTCVWLCNYRRGPLRKEMKTAFLCLFLWNNVHLASESFSLFTRRSYVLCGFIGKNLNWREKRGKRSCWEVFESLKTFLESLRTYESFVFQWKIAWRVKKITSKWQATTKVSFKLRFFELKKSR